MSEIKRVSLTSLEPQKVSDKGAKKPPKTVRISVNLSESTEDKCPEFNYKDELAAVKKKSKHVKNNDVVPNGLDPFGENDDDVRRIALEMEEKYGGNPGTKKKRKGRKDDYADIGMGYDESDSFIDNTDGYDEIIPQNVTTLHGGFYINCGALEFKTDDEASSNISSSSEESADEGDEDDEKPKSPANVNRKRILDTSDEEENSNKSDSQDGKKIKLDAKTSIQQAIKKKLFSPNKIQVKKKRPIDPLKKTVKELLREKRKDLDLSIGSELKSDESIMEKDPLKENKKPMNASSVSDAIESVVKATIGEKKSTSLGYDNNGNKQQNSGVNNVKESANNDQPQSTEGESSRDSTKLENVEIVKLPENLPADISQIIDNLKAAAEKKQSDSKEGKSKFFSEDVNEMLLKLEKKCRCLGKPSKTKIYEHLAPFAKCKKETLIRRAKNLVLNDEEKRLKRYIKLLTDAIEKDMPELLQNYEIESNKILQKRLLLGVVDSEENKMLRMPKRRYHWTDETRKLMRDIIFTKKRCLLLEGKSKENYEDLLMQFFKTELQVLWPEGWMSMSIMKKLYVNLNETKKLDSSTDSSVSKQHSPAINSHTDTNTNISIIPIANSSESNYKKPEKNHAVPNDVTVNKLDSANAASSATATSQKSFESSSSKSESRPKKEEKPVKEKSFDIKNLIDDSKKHKEKHKHEKNDKDSNSVIVVNSKKQKDESKHKAPSVEVKEKEDASLSGNASNSTAVIEASHCQIIDLTESDSPIKLPKTSKSKPEISEKPLKLTKEKSSSHNDNHSNKEYHMEYLDIKKKSKSKHRDERSERNEHKSDRSDRMQFDVNKLASNSMEITVTPSFFNSVSCPPTSEIRNNDGDDIQKVMENLKALQKLSSPIKSETSSPVSVIAYNKSNSSQGSASVPAQQQRNNEYTTSFQDEFQKQILNYIQTPNSSKTNYRCS